MKRKFLLQKMRLVFVIAFVFSFLAHSNAQWKSVRVGGGGAIPSIQAHPKVQNLYFITTDVGTPYRWNSTTQEWEGLFYSLTDSYWGKSAAGNIAFDPSDASGNLLYATIGGTWETGTVLKSVDRGTTWTDCKLPIEVKPNNDQGYGQRLVVDPNNSDVVYVTTRPSTAGVTTINGTFKSVDAGKTWTKINDLCGACLLFDVSGGLTSNVTKNIFIGCADGVYQSTNGGADFNLMTGSPANSARAEIHSNGTMYVTHFKSVSKWDGTSWSSITPVADYRYSAIAVNPNNSNQVIVGFASYNPYLFDHYVTNNGGTSWTKINAVRDITEVPWFASTIGQGLKDFCWDPFDQNMVWFTDFFNPFQTTNIWAGSNVTWKARAVGEEETVGTGNLVSPPSGTNLLLSNVADCGGWDHKSLTASPAIGMMTHFPWSFSGEAGNMTGVAIQETDPNFIARVGRHGWNGKGYSGHSTDGGLNYTKWNCPADAAGGRIAVSASSTTMVWVTQSGPCYRSTDKGTTWNQIFSLPLSIITQADIFSCGPVFPIAADKVNGNKFYVYTYGKLYVSTDAGATFTNSGANLPNPYITNPQVIETTPGKEGDIWIAAYDQGLYHSTNSGTSFTKISNFQLVRSVSVGKASSTNPNNPAVYVTGTYNNITNGLFRSNDNGVTWETISAPLHTGMSAYSMTADRLVYGRVFFNTTGNGIMYVEEQADTKVPTTPTGLVAASMTDISVRLTWSPSTDNVNVASYDIFKDGVLIGNSTACFFNVMGLSAGTAYAISVKAKDPSGNVSAAGVLNVQIPGDFVPSTNIALYKLATANDNNHTAYLGNDGDLTKRWSASRSAYGDWYKVDLGDLYNITGAEMNWLHPTWIYLYKIQVSKDNSTWVMACDKTSNTYSGAIETVNFVSNGYRYIRLTYTGWSNLGTDQAWASIAEFSVFGTRTSTGTNELHTSTVKIYPNPASEYISIENTKPNVEVSVLTLNGTIIYNTKTTNNNFTIPVSNWIKGLYFVRVKDNDGVSVEKVMVQ